MRVYIKRKKKKVQECDGCCGDAGGMDFGMGNVVPGGPDRFDLGFSVSPYTQASASNKKKKKVKSKRRKK